MNLLAGIERTGTVTNIAVGGAAAAVAVYRISDWANQIGTKSFTLKKLLVRNNGGGAGWFNLGITAGAGVAIMPPLWILNNIDNYFELPAIEMWEDLVAWPAALLAGGSVDAQITVEERG